MPKQPMTSVTEITRYITTKSYGFEVWRGMAEAPDRETLRTCAKKIRRLGFRCRMATIPHSGFFGYPERYALIMPEGSALGKGEMIDNLWHLLDEMDNLV